MDVGRNPRIPIEGLLDRIRSAGGPSLEAVRELGGEVGAWLVRRLDGTTSVLTWGPPVTDHPESSTFDGIAEFVERARLAGCPAPAYQEVVVLPEGDIAIIQQRAPGQAPHEVDAGLVDQMLDHAERRRGLLADTRWTEVRSSLSLRDSGPGFCLHEPLAGYDRRTRRLLARIREIGARPDADEMAGGDLVHFDYHPRNVLVDRDSGTITAIVDWDGARPGDVALDLAVLAISLTLRPSESGLAERVERHLVATSAPQAVQRMWAHAALRMLDWSIRHHPDQVDHWIAVAPRYL